MKEQNLRITSIPHMAYDALLATGRSVCQSQNYKLVIKRNILSKVQLFFCRLVCQQRFSFFVSAKKVAKQAGSLVGFGFSVGFERPDNVPACVSWQYLLKTIL
jgi:hypothetical protein